MSTHASIDLGLITPGSRAAAASQALAQKLLTTTDEFVSAQTQFDRQARLNLTEDAVKVTPAIYFNYVSSQALAWTPVEIEALRKIAVSIQSKFSKLQIHLPKEIFLIKTTGLEEGYAAYTRSLNIICLPMNMVASLASASGYDDPLHPATSTEFLENVIIHELFHLFSKNNPAQRKVLYSLLGYEIMGNSLELPDCSWAGGKMRDLKITNPDTPKLDVFISLDLPEAVARKSAIPPGPTQLTPILLANAPYAGGIFFQYLKWYFMPVEKGPSGWGAKVNTRGEPYLIAAADLLPEYEAKVGTNFTQEIFHPDEIMAQSFVLVANQPGMDLLQKIKVTLTS